MNFLIKAFKTNIKDEKIAKKVIENLNAILPYCSINFDLNDCDNVLRIVAKHPVDIEILVTYIKKEGFLITLLD
jgi:hypothetical protein